MDMIGGSHDVANHLNSPAISFPTANYEIDRAEASLSTGPTAVSGGPLRFALILLLIALAVGLGAFALTGRLQPMFKHVANELTALLPSRTTSAILPLATPSLSGQMTLLPLSPTELMQQYPPAGGQSLSDGNFTLPDWQRYRRPALPMTAQPHIAVLLTGLGLNKAITATAILYLPPDISLSFSPYAPDLADWIKTARAHGHEALVDLPSQSAAPQDDPGADGLMTGLRSEENLARLNRILARAPQVIGVATTFGSRFLTDAGDLQPILGELGNQGLAAVDASPDPRLQVSQLSATAKQPYLKAGFAIDGTEGRNDILQNLAFLSSNVQDRPHRLVVVAPTPLSLALIAGWCKELDSQGIQLTPVSNMLAQ